MNLSQFSKNTLIESTVHIVVLAILAVEFAFPHYTALALVPPSMLANNVILEEKTEPTLAPVAVNEEKVDEKQLPVSEPVKPKQVIQVVATAYSSTPDQTDDSPFIAAWGDHVYWGMIASNFLPRNTAIKIPDLYGDKIFYVQDRMNKRYGYGRLDIWMETRQEAITFGSKSITIEIY